MLIVDVGDDAQRVAEWTLWCRSLMRIRLGSLHQIDVHPIE